MTIWDVIGAYRNWILGIVAVSLWGGCLLWYLLTTGMVKVPKWTFKR